MQGPQVQPLVKENPDPAHCNQSPSCSNYDTSEDKFKEKLECGGQATAMDHTQQPKCQRVVLWDKARQGPTAVGPE